MAVKTGKINFYELMEQHERSVRYQIHRLRQHDLCQEVYFDGLFSTWHAYKKYKSHDGVLSIYFNYTIRERLIACMRKRIEKMNTCEGISE